MSTPRSPIGFWWVGVAMMRTVAVLGVVATVAAGVGVAPALARQTRGRPAIEEARQLLEEAFEFEQVVSTLDTAIEIMTSSPDPDSEVLARAYELRGRAYLSLNNPDQATHDFERLLQVRADHLLADDLSPRVVERFEAVRRRLVGTLLLDLPQPTSVTIDGRAYQVERQAVIDLIEGDHELAIRQPGFREVSQEFTIIAREFTQLFPPVERISATRSVITVPAGVSVIVDDILRGATVAGTAGRGESAPLLVDDLTPGQHSLRLERECFEPIVTEFGVADPPGDRTERIELVPAVATVSVQTAARAATIYVDGEPHGLAPAELVDLCEGPHVIEVRAADWRFVDRRIWDAGTTQTLNAELRPAFAIVEVAGGTDVVDTVELASRVEAALAASRGVLIFAPTINELEAATSDLRLRDALAASDAMATRRRDLATAWSERLNTQGVAWLTPIAGETDVYDLFVLAADSGTPDVLRLEMDDFGSRAAAERRLGSPLPPIARTTLQTFVVDVARVEGAAVIRVEAGGAGDVAGLRPSDLIVGAAGTDVRTAADLARVVSSTEPGAELSLDVRADDGAARRMTTARVALVPDTIPFGDDRLLYNKILLDLQAAAPGADSTLIGSAT